MLDSPPTAKATWPAHAARLARRCTRRARLGALLPRVAVGVLLGTVPALLCRLVPALAGVAPLAPSFIVLGGALGIVVGLRRARALPAVRPGDAAWALDRVGALAERGLTAATVEGPRGAEAAWAAPALAPPPAARLLPPPGLALFVGSLLVAAIALVALPAPMPAGVAAAPAVPDATAPGVGPASPADAAAALEQAAVDTEVLRARAQAALRTLDLPTDEPVDPSELAERLADPQQRQAAADAAKGTALEAGFAAGGRNAEGLARALNSALGPADRARDQRRDAVALRALDPRAPVPPHRRDVVERYYELEGDRR